ncbi:MAG: polysaccharide deacetylase family protein [Oscillospiraceae bacterium]|nr:polysaccharide deacetylase family protein [Oscillospiraceae bacterium]
MFVYTVTKKRAVRMLLLVLALIAGIIIGVAAILTAISSSADERKLPIYHVDREDNKVSLTFNCAWGNSNTDELLTILDKENIKASFFVTGEFCDKYPEDVLKMFKSGHEIQSHSNNHPHVEGANINDFIADTREAENKITKITGVTPTLYRAPYGEYDNNSIFTINGMGYKYIQWSVDSVDWQEHDANTIVKRVLSGTKSGSIILFHNDLDNTTEALPTVITRLKEKGFDFLPVSELIYSDNYKIDHSGKQILTGENLPIEAQVHTPGTRINSAFEILLNNLTIEELMSLEDGISAELAMKLSTVLSKDEIDAISSLSDDELQSAWAMLVEAKATGNLPQLSANNEQNTVAATTPSDVKGGNNQIAGADNYRPAPPAAAPASTTEVRDSSVNADATTAIVTTAVDITIAEEIPTEAEITTDAEITNAAEVVDPKY